MESWTETNEIACPCCGSKFDLSPVPWDYFGGSIDARCPDCAHSIVIERIDGPLVHAYEAKATG